MSFRHANPSYIPSFFSTSSLKAQELWLKVGEVLTLPAKPEATVRVGQRGLIRVVDAGNKIQVVGLKPGFTPLVVDQKSYKVTVSRSNQKHFYQELKQILSRMKGLKLVSDAFPIEISGTLLRFSDWQKIADLSQRLDGQYQFKARALPDVAETALGHFQKLAQDKGLPLHHFTYDTQLSIHVPSGKKSFTQSVENTFAHYGVRIIASDATLSIQPLVRTQVLLAEVSRSQGRIFGLEWPSEYKAQVIPKMAGEATLSATLRALEAEGQAQILASPNLLCRSGSEARFHAGGEFPIRMISRGNREVVWKSHGVVMRVKPQADFSGAMSLELETEISMVDQSSAVDGVPGLKTNKVKSHFDLPGKRTIALSGLMRQSFGEDMQGLPWLSQIPVLGRLFSSRSFQAHQSELVVFVTPEIYTPDTDEPIQMPKGWVRHEW